VVGCGANGANQTGVVWCQLQAHFGNATTLWRGERYLVGFAVRNLTSGGVGGGDRAVLAAALRALPQPACLAPLGTTAAANATAVAPRPLLAYVRDRAPPSAADAAVAAEAAEEEAAGAAAEAAAEGGVTGVPTNASLASQRDYDVASCFGAWGAGYAFNGSFDVWGRGAGYTAGGPSTGAGPLCGDLASSAAGSAAATGSGSGGGSGGSGSGAGFGAAFGGLAGTTGGAFGRTPLRRWPLTLSLAVAPADTLRDHLTLMAGTSMATPVTAGAAAVVSVKGRRARVALR
jgi:hypothetical protein